MAGLNITVARKSKAPQFAKNLKKIGKMAAYVGVPAAANGRKSKGKDDVNNAELLFIHTKGSPANHIPARAVVEPAIEADGNRQAIAHEIAEASKAVLDDKPGEAQRRMKRAGMAGQNAAREWFTDPRNNWAPNAPSTIAAKGSDRPMINEGILRGALTYVVKDDE